MQCACLRPSVRWYSLHPAQRDGQAEFICMSRYFMKYTHHKQLTVVDQLPNSRKWTTTKWRSPNHHTFPCVISGRIFQQKICTSVGPSLRLRSHRHEREYEYESGVSVYGLSVTRTSFTRMSGAYAVTCTST